MVTRVTWHASCLRSSFLCPTGRESPSQEPDQAGLLWCVPPPVGLMTSGHSHRVFALSHRCQCMSLCRSPFFPQVVVTRASGLATAFDSPILKMALVGRAVPVSGTLWAGSLDGVLDLVCACITCGGVWLFVWQLL